MNTANGLLNKMKNKRKLSEKNVKITGKKKEKSTLNIAKFFTLRNQSSLAEKHECGVGQF